MAEKYDVHHDKTATVEEEQNETHAGGAVSSARTEPTEPRAEPTPKSNVYAYEAREGSRSVAPIIVGVVVVMVVLLLLFFLFV